MRKAGIYSSLIIISTLVFTFSSCKDKDKFAPKIFINGNETINTELEKTFYDPGAIAEDNLDGSITSSISYGHNIPMKPYLGDSVTSRTGSFLFNYSVTDKAGNQAIATRNVVVRNWAWPYEVDYMLYRKKVSGNDSIGAQYGANPLRTPKKYKITTNKTENTYISLPIGGELGIKIKAKFIGETKIFIPTQDTVGIKVFPLISNQINTYPVRYRIKDLGTESFPESYVEDTVSGRKLLIIKYLISKYDSNTHSFGNNISYVDTLKQRF
ncbi:MAG: hypothetical protein A2275_08940 [Bacteroidetes bacterium RIFOXYA12_FULL_35_11]|nr:MAG: hypothetical protein A2X01_06065 [Bacteroidetes bacterium GWF2_35_48]OFY82926.1 MAG: hypothetical protein A2275_08940 [Bacteroidetes bacterium RIFOXYA12_FULL_35_11]OFZ01880.1 MAG: hypothetical protein A2491_02400 [Bacteroidetes bacterium RIFOXYC12_FULL_35_7]HBX52762.1 hypothetical protein [Bacteroidales bacterium]